MFVSVEIAVKRTPIRACMQSAVFCAGLKRAITLKQDTP